jgi:hypothetical protein
LPPKYPLLHEHVSGAIHVPLDAEQTVEFEAAIPKQIGTEQSLPVYPELQLQWLRGSHFPCPEQVELLVNGIP